MAMSEVFSVPFYTLIKLCFTKSLEWSNLVPGPEAKSSLEVTNLTSFTISYQGSTIFSFFLSFVLFIYYFFILFFNFTILYWFCHISTWIRHRYTRVLHPEPSSLLPPHTIPLGHRTMSKWKHFKKAGIFNLFLFTYFFGQDLTRLLESPLAWISKPFCEFLPE